LLLVVELCYIGDMKSNASYYIFDEDREVILNDITAESFMVEDEGVEVEIFPFDEIIYKNERYLFLAKDRDYLTNQNADEEVYVYKVKVHKNNCALIDFDEAFYDEVMEFYNENDSTDQQVVELAELDKICTRVDDGTNSYSRKQMKEGRLICIIGIIATVLGAIFAYWTFGMVVGLGAIFAIIGGIFWGYYASKMSARNNIVYGGKLVPAYVSNAEAKEQALPFMAGNIAGVVSEEKCTIHYTFMIGEEQVTHKVRLTGEVYNYLLDKFDLIVSYDKYSGKSALVSLYKGE